MLLWLQGEGAELTLNTNKKTQLIAGFRKMHEAVRRMGRRANSETGKLCGITLQPQQPRRLACRCQKLFGVSKRGRIDLARQHASDLFFAGFSIERPDLSGQFGSLMLLY